MFYVQHVTFMDAMQHFMGAKQCFMVASLRFMGSMVISRLTYQHLDLYYPQFVDTFFKKFWLPYHTVNIGDTWNKGDTAYARRVHIAFIRACTVRLHVSQSVISKWPVGFFKCRLVGSSFWGMGGQRVGP